MSSLMGWMRANKLKLNPGKMEALWVSGSQVWEVGPLLVLDGVALLLKDQVHSLGVLLDPSLSLEAQVAMECLLPALSGSPAMASTGLGQLVHSGMGISISRLDYCNALHVGLPLKLLRKLKLCRMLHLVVVRCCLFSAFNSFTEGIALATYWLLGNV